MWSDFHSDPRTSYYLSLRRGYVCSASQAYAKVKRIDAMIVGLEHSGRRHKWRAFLIARLVKLMSWNSRTVSPNPNWSGTSGKMKHG